MRNIDSLVDKVLESPFSSEADKMLCLSLIDEALTKSRADVDKSRLKSALANSISSFQEGVFFSNAPLDV